MANERIRFLTENHIAGAVVEALRQRQVDVMTTIAVGHGLTPDDLLLKFAREQGRVLVTGDHGFIRLHHAGQPHAGIVLIRNTSLIGPIVETLMLLHEALTAEEINGRIEYW